MAHKHTIWKEFDDAAKRIMAVLEGETPRRKVALLSAALIEYAQEEKIPMENVIQTIRVCWGK